MALVPVIQPPIMKLLTTKEERQIEMKTLRPVSKTEKMVFPIVVTIIVALLVPSAAPLIGMLMLGNLIKRIGRSSPSRYRSKRYNNVYCHNLLGVTVGQRLHLKDSCRKETLGILFMGLIAFAIGTAFGVIFAKIMNLFSKEKVNR